MKKKKILILLFFLSFSCLIFSQTRTGILTGRVIDEQGESIPGATVTISSPVLIQGTLSTITNERGLYRFISLPPGVYSLKILLEGFTPYEQTGIRIKLGLTTTINVSLKVSSIDVKVEVVAESPMVDVESNKLSVNYDINYLAKLPSSRNLDAFMGMTPGVVVDTVSGAQFPDRATLGGGARENYFSMDGTYLTDPGNGQQMIYWNYDIIEEAQVEAVGHDAQYGNAAGAIVNVVTKSGGDTFHGMGNFYYRNKSMRSENHEGTGLDAPSNAIKNEWEASINLGGPIIKEKIWFFLSGGYIPTVSETVGFPEDIERKQKFFFGKATAQLNPKHKLSFVYNYSEDDTNHMWADQFTAPEATANSDQWTSTLSLQWNYMINNNALLELRGAYIKRSTTYNSNGTGASYYELTTGMTTNSYTSHLEEQTRRRYQFQSSFSYWLQGFGGDHDLKFGFEFEQGEAGYFVDWAKDAPGEPTLLFTMQGAPYMSIVMDPPQIKNRIDRFQGFSFYTQDTWKLGSRLSLNIGARLNTVKGFIPKQDRIPQTIDDYNFTNIEPRVGFVCDISTRSRQIALKAHYGRYYMNSMALGWQNINWSDFLYYLYIGGNPVLINVRSRSGITVDSDLRRPYSDSVILGFETEVTKKLAFKLNGIYKKYKDFVGAIDLNRTEDWYEPVEVQNPITNSPLTVYNLKPGAPTISHTHYTNPEEAERTYKGIQFIFERRLSNNFQFMVSYTWSKVEGTVHQGVWAGLGMQPYGTWNDPNTFVNARGSLDLDKTHQIKFNGVYYAPFGFIIGLNYIAQSGYPYARYFNASLNQGNVSFNGEKPGTQRTPFQNLIDLRIEKNFTFGTIQPRIFFEAFNLLNSNTATGIGALYASPTYNKTITIMPPRIFRVGIGLNF